MLNTNLYYPADWPQVPFHQGEVYLQTQAGVHDSVMTWAPKAIRPYMPNQHMEFYQHQPFLVAAARDLQGNMWSSLWMSPTGQADLVLPGKDPKQLVLQGGPVVGDALKGQLASGTDVGLLGIEFATKRRNRVNGRLTLVEHDKLVFQVDQSFGNCPQYIQPRQWWSVGTQETETNPSRDEQVCRRPTQLTLEQIKMIAQADTIFVATGYRGAGNDVRYGNDASHRGGPAGFVIVQDARTLVLPDFAGNNMMNTLGNLHMDPRMGITFVDFEQGRLVQLSGRAHVDMDATRAAKVYPGALRLITFEIEQVNVVDHLPIRWSSSEQERPLQIVSIVQESLDVKSFYLRPLPQDKRPLWTFQAGQHLPIRLELSGGGQVSRTYSLSGSNVEDYYRISVKRQELGTASRILHDTIKEGDVIEVQRPAGDFVLAKPQPIVGDETNDMQTTNAKEQTTLVLLSSGIGLTPLLSMLHQVVTNDLNDSHGYRRVLWIHGARDGEHHALHGEVQALQAKAKHVQLDIHVRYSRPTKNDDASLSSDDYCKGRIDAALLEALLSHKEERVNHTNYYLCGPGAFMTSMEDHLEGLGVDSSQIHVESF